MVGSVIALFLTHKLFELNLSDSSVYPGHFSIFLITFLYQKVKYFEYWTLIPVIFSQNIIFNKNRFCDMEFWHFLFNILSSLVLKLKKLVMNFQFIFVSWRR